MLANFPPRVRLRVLPALIPVNGKDVQLRATATAIQQRLGNGEWTDVIPLSEIQGPIGPGTELRSDGDNIQYRPVGAPDWVNIISVNDLASYAAQQATATLQANLAAAVQEATTVSTEAAAVAVEKAEQIEGDALQTAADRVATAADVVTSAANADIAAASAGPLYDTPELGAGVVAEGAFYRVKGANGGVVFAKLYKKSGGVGVYQSLDTPSAAAVKANADKIAELAIVLPINLFGGEYLLGAITGTTDIFTIDAAGSVRRVVAVNVTPGQRYTVAKIVSERFVIAEYAAKPVNGSVASRRVKGSADLAQGLFTTAQGEAVEYFSFVAEAPWIGIYLSLSLSQQPRLFVYEGYFSGDSFGLAKMGKAIVASNIVLGKNLWDGSYTQAYLADSGGLATGYTSGVAGASIICRVEPNKTYSISTVGNARFRLSAWKIAPKNLSIGPNTRIIRGQADPLISEFTFTTLDREIYIMAYLVADLAATGLPFVQVELGAKTAWETHGYKFLPAALPLGSSGGGGSEPDPETGTVGNANYRNGGAMWADAAFTIPATDDHAALQALLMSGTAIWLEPNKNYLISSPLVVSPGSLKYLNGNGSTIVVNGDFDAVKHVGTLDNSASPDVSGNKIFPEHGAIVTNLKVTSADKGSGTGIHVEKNFGLRIVNCSFTFMKRGIALAGLNRNLIITDNHAYACLDYGIHFDPTCNVHQINIADNHISYCRKNVFSENATIFNIQIVGNDIETSSYPAVADCNIHFLQTSAVLEDLKIVGNSIEDHADTTKMIVLEGNPMTTDNIGSVSISGNVIGNSDGDEIVIGGARGVEISGSFKNSAGYTLKVNGNINGLVMSGVVAHKNGGGLLHAVGGYSLTGVKIDGNTLVGAVDMNPIMVDVTGLKLCSFSENDLLLSSLADGDATKAPVYVRAYSVSMTRVDDNTLDNVLETAQAVAVIARTSSVKGSMRGNMAKNGAFVAPATFLISENS